jgi:hypothetical protein
VDLKKTIAKISHRPIREGVLSRISSGTIAQDCTTAEQNSIQEHETSSPQFRPEDKPRYLSSIIEATGSASVLQPNISSKQTYWSCEDFDDDLPTSSKPYLQKYSSASTIDLQESQPTDIDKHQFEQLVHKYNLYAYVQTEVSGYPPLPNYAESTQQSSGESSISAVDTSNNRHEMSNLPSQPQYGEAPSLETMKKFCGIPARLSGFFSLIAQIIIMLIALALTILMFYQLGGYTFLSSTTNSAENDNGTFPTPIMLEISNLLENSTDMVNISLF